MINPFRSIVGVDVLANELLSRHTSFHIGGKARYLVKVYSQRALKKVLDIIRKQRIRYYVIGSGTNVLVSDEGFPGVIIKLYGIFRSMKKRGDIFYCGSGFSIEHLLQKAKGLGYAGAEFLAGIPGTIGGAIKGNAGAFGKSMAEIVIGVTVITDRIIISRLSNREIRFGYRQTKIKDGVVILSAELKLIRRKRRDITTEIRNNLAYRKQRQPNGYSAGSYFKNIKPYVAGKLIEDCGLKGLSVGDAEISRKHGNFIINRGHAKASDVLELAEIIKKKVKNIKGIMLKEEVKLLK